jgi:sugar phosphate isomerase/epimerase
MVKWGIHSLLWAERFDTNPEPVTKKAKEFGFDGIEIYVAPSQIDSGESRVTANGSMHFRKCSLHG